jgi:hypothetical protein
MKAAGECQTGMDKKKDTQYYRRWEEFNFIQAEI